MTTTARVSAQQIDEQVRSLGGTIAIARGKLRVIQPQGGLPAELRRAIVEQKDALMKFLSGGRKLSAQEFERHELLLDPRQRDIPEDTELWQYIFWHRIEDAGVEDELLHILRTIRIAGARIEWSTNGLRILPGEELPIEWAEIREEWLKPHAQSIQTLLNTVFADDRNRKERES